MLLNYQDAFLGDFDTDLKNKQPVREDFLKFKITEWEKERSLLQHH